MPTIVSKFGGSSTANAGCFYRILSILRDSPARRFVVLSAPGTDAAHDEKVTAMLAECWRLRREDRLCHELALRIARRYGEIANALGIEDYDAFARSQIEGALDISLDHALSRGEYLCAELFARFSGWPMVDAAEVVRFDDSGVLNEAATFARFEEMAKAYERAVIPGFYGANGSGHIRAFPRNGSDISGALAAAGVGADLYENWTDVPGLMTADPAVVPEARLIGQVSYRQMRALARAGAKVLHPACLDPVAMAGIPTRLRCTAQADCYGTLIDEHATRVEPCIVGKACDRLSDGSQSYEDAFATISVFGVQKDKVIKAAEALHPLCVENGMDHVRVYVREGNMNDGIRHLHRALLG